MALGDRRKQKNEFSPLKLQITSMMDMFTIMLIFLLFSFSNEPETMQLDKNLQLPLSSAVLAYKEKVKLVLSQTNLKLGDKTIATIKDGEILGFNHNKPEKSELYRQLKYYLGEEKKKRKDEDTNGYILFLCDKRLPFKTIDHIVKAAAIAGYPNFKFTVLDKQS